MTDAFNFDAEGVVHQTGRHGEPLNAEPDAATLTSSVITQQSDLYRRNHGEIIYQPPSKDDNTHWKLDLIVDRDVAEELGWQQWESDSQAETPSRATEDADDLSDYHRRVMATSKTTSQSVAELQQKFQERTVVAAMECAGNRRSDISKRGTKAEGIQWSQGTIGNALWQGASLREFLLAQGIPDPYAHHSSAGLEQLAPTAESIMTDSAEWARRTYVQFLSAQPSSESTDPAGQFFGSSLTLATALHPNQDVLLCWAASRQQLGSSHGYPLRAVIPGHVAARWVKWLRTLRISRFENDSPPMKDDYKVLRPPAGASETERKEWMQKMMGENKDGDARQEELHKAEPLMRLGVGSGLSEPSPDSQVEQDASGRFQAKGYAVGTEGSPVTLVELILVPDSAPPSSSDSAEAERSLESLRQSANAADASQWFQLKLDQNNSTKVSPVQTNKTAGTDDGELSIADVQDSNRNGFSWSWTLWTAEMTAPTASKDNQDGRWALVVRCTTSAGVQQELQSPWNVRGFRERSWPVVRGLKFSS